MGHPKESPDDGEYEFLDVQMIPLDADSDTIYISAVRIGAGTPSVEIETATASDRDRGLPEFAASRVRISLAEALGVVASLRHVVAAGISAVLHTPAETLLGEVATAAHIADGPRWLRVAAVADSPGELTLRIDRGGAADDGPLMSVPFSLALRVWDAFEAVAYAALVAEKAHVPSSSGPTLHEVVPQLLMLAAHANDAGSQLVH